MCWNRRGVCRQSARVACWYARCGSKSAQVDIRMCSRPGKWLSTDSGRFTIADHDVLKLYAGVRNVIMRISAKQGIRGEKDAVLLGSHIDSTLPAPGAAE